MDIKPFWVNIELFNISIKFYFGSKYRKSAEKALGAKNDREDIEGFSNGNVIWLHDDAGIDALVHEIYHSVCWLQSYVGTKDEETSAYLMSYLFTKSIEKFNKWKEAV